MVQVDWGERNGPDVVSGSFKWYPIRVRRVGRLGFSLAELMVALMLLMVISLMLTGIIPATITGMGKASQRTNATLLADNRMALLREAGFGNVVETVPPHEAHKVGQTDYILEVDVAQASLSDGSLMDIDVAKLVSIKVSWEDRNGSQSLTTRAVMFKRI